MKSERANSFLRRIDRWLGIPLTAPAACWRKFSPRQELAAAPAKIGIFCPGAVGDLLLLSILTDALRKRFPSCRLELLASHANSGALPLNPHADVRRSWPLGRPDRILAYIRESKYDVFLDASQWARLGNLLANLSGAGMTAGFASKGQFRRLGYDRICEHSPKCHETENFLNLGRAVWPELDGRPCLNIPQTRLPGPEHVIYCHMWPSPGPGRIFKEWPQENWAELIRSLLPDGYEIRLTGSCEDSAACKIFIERFFPNSTHVKSIAGLTTWPELARLFRQASAVISVNTGVMHLAALTGVPTVGLHGATNPVRWGPIGPKTVSLLPTAGEGAYLNLGFEYPRGVKPAMRHISVAAVCSALRELGIAV